MPILRAPAAMPSPDCRRRSLNRHLLRSVLRIVNGAWVIWLTMMQVGGRHAAWSHLDGAKAVELAADRHARHRPPTGFMRMARADLALFGIVTPEKPIAQYVNRLEFRACKGLLSC